MPLKTLIVDDEPLAREGLRDLLAKDGDISAILQANDGRAAVAAIREHSPDLVLLDVQMPAMDGFEVVRDIGAESMPPVVFVTAHDQYAIQAFEINALDYLLKPVIEERFNRTLARAKARILARAPGAGEQIIGLLETIAARSPTPDNASRKYLKRIAVRSADKIALLHADDVDWVQGAENYVELHAGPATHLVHVTMKVFEKSLDPETFLRIHRSIIINLNRIKTLQLGAHGEYVLTLHHGVRLQSGRTYGSQLKALATNRFPP